MSERKSKSEVRVGADFTPIVKVPPLSCYLVLASVHQRWSWGQFERPASGRHLSEQEPSSQLAGWLVGSGGCGGVKLNLNFKSLTFSLSFILQSQIQTPLRQQAKICVIERIVFEVEKLFLFQCIIIIIIIYSYWLGVQTHKLCSIQCFSSHFYSKH